MRGVTSGRHIYMVDDMLESCRKVLRTANVLGLYAGPYGMQWGRGGDTQGLLWWVCGCTIGKGAGPQ